MPHSFDHHQRTVDPALRPYLGDLVGYAYRGMPLDLHRGLPSRYLTIVVSLDEPLGLAWPGEPVEKFSTLVGGLHSTAVRIGDSPNKAGIQLSLTPAGARALLGVPPGELGSLVIHLDDLLGTPARVLSERIRDESSWEERFDVLENYLLRAWRDEPAPEPRAE